MKRNNNVFKMPALVLLLPLTAGLILPEWSNAAWPVMIMDLLLILSSFAVSCNFMPVGKSFVQIFIFIAAGCVLMEYEAALTDFSLATFQQPSEIVKPSESVQPSEIVQPSESVQPLESVQPSDNSKFLTATLLLTSDPVCKGKRLRCDVFVVNVLEEEKSDKQKAISFDCRQKHFIFGKCAGWKGRSLQIYLLKDSAAVALRMGDCICARFVPQRPESYSDDFDYASYLRSKGFTATAYISADKWRIAGNENLPLLWRLRIKAERCRAHLIHTYEKYGIDGDRLALVSALSLGKKDLMDREVRDRFAAAGVSHVLAVSGMHVGIVYAFVNAVIALIWKCLGRLKKLFNQPLADKRRRNPEPYVEKRTGLIIRQLIVVAVLWGYAFITGLPASVIRAVTMFTLSAGAACLNRRSQTWNNLFFTAFLMLCIHPSYLFDIGFQMSFVAVMAILLFLPVFEQLLGLGRNDEALSLLGEVVFSQLNCENTTSRVTRVVFSKVWRYLVSSLLISIAAQLGTAPLSIYYFHRYPQWFLLANLVLVPTAVALTWAALAFQCLAAISIIPDAILSAAANLLSVGLDFFTEFAFFIERLPWATVDGLMPSLEEIAFIYVLLACAFCFFQKRTYLYTLENLLRRIRCAKYDKYMKNR